MRNKKAIAQKLAQELAETRALQPRLKREMYERQAATQYAQTLKRPTPDGMESGDANR